MSVTAPAQPRTVESWDLSTALNRHVLTVYWRDADGARHVTETQSVRPFEPWQITGAVAAVRAGMEPTTLLDPRPVLGRAARRAVEAAESFACAVLWQNRTQ